MDLAGNNEVTLEEMLDARERRVFLQNSLIQTYNKPIISFTLNIPGPVKVFDKIPETFEEGVRKIRQALCDSVIMKARSVKRPDMKLFFPPMLPLLS